jgi:hypothetical protein
MKDLLGAERYVVRLPCWIRGVGATVTLLRADWALGRGRGGPEGDREEKRDELLGAD